LRAGRCETAPGADEFGPPNLHAGQCLSYSRRDHSLRVLEVRRIREPDQDVLRRAELLHPQVAEAERREGFADHVDLERLWPAQLDNRTATEIDPEIEARVEEEHDR